MRDYDVSSLSTPELERARRELAASLALARPGSPVRAPILAKLTVIDAELAWRRPGTAAGSTASLPPPADAVRITGIMRQHPRWSVFWDKAYGLWRAAEDDPDSGLYAESPEADAIIAYIAAHS